MQYFRGQGSTDPPGDLNGHDGRSASEALDVELRYPDSIVPPSHYNGVKIGEILLSSM